MTYIQPLKQIPAKSEIAEYVQQYKEQDGLSPIEKYANLKFLEEFVKKGLAELKNDAKDDFLKMFNGATKMDFMGIEVSLKNMSKSNTLKDPTYEFSNNIVTLERALSEAEANVRYIKDRIKLEKTAEINNGTAKKLDDMFEEPKESKDDFQLVISLRK